MVSGGAANTKKPGRSFGGRAFDIGICAVVIAVTVVCFYPMLYVLFASFSDPTRLMENRGLLLWPQGMTLGGYKTVLNNPNTYIGYGNTILYVAGGTALNMVMTVLGAYALSRPDFWGKKAFTVLIVFTMYFSGGLIPNFLLVKELGLLNTRLAMILPGAVGTWNMLIMRTAFRSIPASLEEAAIIDGANDFQTLFHVILPVSKATLAVVFLFYAVGHWNEWFPALIYLPRARHLYPLQMFLRELLITSVTAQQDAGAVDLTTELVKYSTTVVSTLPILCLYPFLQKYFVKGVMLGSVKG